MEKENSQKELSAPRVIGSVDEASNVQGNDTVSEPSSKEPSVIPDASGVDVSGINEEGSHDSMSPEEMDSSDVLGGCQLPQQGETALRQRPGPWMSL